MIVKVSLPAQNDSHVSALVQSKDGTVRFYVPLSTVLLARMNGKTTRFFQGDVRGHGAPNEPPTTRSFELSDDVPDQDW